MALSKPIQVHIVAIDTGLQAHAIRATAEHFGASVMVIWAGNSAQVVDCLSSRPRADVIVLSAHGDERGMLLPHIDEEFSSLYPYSDAIRPTDFAQFLALDGSVVLNNGCMGGTDEMAAAFLSCGASAYAGATDYPDAAASTKYVLDFLYSYLLQHVGDVERAHQVASTVEDDRQMFRLYAGNRTG